MTSGTCGAPTATTSRSTFSGSSAIDGAQRTPSMSGTPSRTT